MKVCALHQLFVALFLWSWFSVAAASGNHSLVILNWVDYLDPEIIAEFEKKYDAEISQIYYDSDEQRSNMLVSNSGEGYDLILCAGIDLASYARNNLIAPLDVQNIPNNKYISSRWKSAYEGAQAYGIAYFWGTIGIVYRSDLIQPEEKSWKFLFEPPEALKGRIAMMADGREFISMALKTLGYSVNSERNEELREVEDLLMKQKPFVQAYQYVNFDENSELVTGDVWASMIYSGDALMLTKYAQNLKYFAPKEGTNIWVDYFALGAKARNVDLAYAFLNFINSPEVAARQAQYTNYASPNMAAVPFLPEAFLNNPVIYPSEEVLSRSEFYQPLSPRQYLRRQKLSVRVAGD